MLSKDFQKRLLAERGVSTDEAEKIINSEDEQSPSLGDGRFYSQEDINRIEVNKKTEGFKYGGDQVIEAIKKAKGLEYSGLLKLNEKGAADIEESIKPLIEAIEEKTKSSYTGAVDDQVKDLEEKLNVQKSVFEKQLEEQKNHSSKLNGELHRINSNNEIFSYLTGDINSPKEAVLYHMYSEIEPYQDNGKWYVKDKSGNVIKNDMHDPVTLKDFTAQFIDKNGYIKKEDATPTGGFEEGKAAFQSMEEYQNYCQKNSIELMSNEGIKLLNEAKSNGLKVQ